MDETEKGLEERGLTHREFFLLMWVLFFGLFFAVAALCGGCCKISVRASNGRYMGPYMCAPYPYNCTSEVWSDCICAPWKLKSGPDSIWYGIATMTWPFWVVDEVCEVALGTVFLPVDATYLCCKRK